MNSIEERILGLVVKTFPKMSELERERLLAFCEGMAFKAEQQTKELHKETQIG